MAAYVDNCPAIEIKHVFLSSNKEYVADKRPSIGGHFPVKNATNDVTQNQDGGITFVKRRTRDEPIRRRCIHIVSFY